MTDIQNLPLFSVIIATRDRTSQLKDAIRSVLRQAYTNWELLIVDDGSMQPVRDLGTLLNDSRIVILENAVSVGPALSRIRAVNVASGHYLCFLDDDDWLLQDHLANIHSAMSAPKDGCTLFCTGMKILHVDNTESRQATHRESADFLKAFWRRPFNMLPFAIPRSVFTTNIQQAYDSPIEDFAWLAILISVCPVIHVTEASVVYNEHDQNRTKKRLDRRALDERIAVILKLRDHAQLKLRLTSKDFKFQLCHQSLHWGRQCLRNYMFTRSLHGILYGMRNMTLDNTWELVYTGTVAGRYLLRWLFRRSLGK